MKSLMDLFRTHSGAEIYGRFKTDEEKEQAKKVDADAKELTKEVTANYQADIDKIAKPDKPEAHYKIKDGSGVDFSRNEKMQARKEAYDQDIERIDFLKNEIFNQIEHGGGQTDVDDVAIRFAEWKEAERQEEEKAAKAAELAAKPPSPEKTPHWEERSIVQTFKDAAGRNL